MTRLKPIAKVWPTTASTDRPHGCGLTLVHSHNGLGKPMNTCQQTSPSSQDVSREALLGRGLSLVRRIAFSVARQLPSFVDVNDLIGAGHVGLLDAIQRYDSDRGADLESFVKPRIRGAITDYLRASDHVTRYARNRANEIANTIVVLRQSLGRQPAEDEVAHRLRMPLGEYQHLTGLIEPTLRGLFSLSAEDMDVVEGNTVAPDAALIDAEQRQLLRYALSKLTSREQQVLTLYYFDELTQLEIGELLDVTESRVCQIMTDAKARLRWLMETLPTWQQARRAAAKTQGPVCASPS